MKKAYIIAAHKNPGQVCRLINRLDDGNSTFFVHIDKKVNIAEFNCLNKFGSKIRLVERVVSRWATIGQVQSTLNAMKAIVDLGEHFEIVSFLSGQDYPIKTNKAIDRVFKSSPYSIFLNYFPLPDYSKWKDDGGLWRVNKYFFGMEQYNLYLSKASNLLSTLLPPLKKNVPEGMQPYLGSAWFSMDLEAIKYILRYVEKNPKYLAFQKYAFSPDELFYLMILVNSPDEHIRKKIVNDNKRLIKWRSWSTAHPETLTTMDFEEIRTSDALFARKFDPKVDAAILDRIDSEILLK